MRLLPFFFALMLILLPQLCSAADECAVGYDKNTLGLCERKPCEYSAPLRCQSGQVVNDAVCPLRCSPRCPDGFYYDVRVKLCAPLCVNGGAMGIGERGDVICKLPETLKESERHAARCATMGRIYVPQTGVCGGVAKGKAGGTYGSSSECAKGMVATRLGGSLTCKKGDPEKVREKIYAQMEKQGMSYLDFMKATLEAQTNKDFYVVVESRIKEVEREIAEEKAGKTPAKKQDETIYGGKKSECPQGYLPNSDGKGCRPERDCSMYRCPDGSTPTTQRSGDSYYCGC